MGNVQQQYISTMKNIIKQLRELRRQAGYEPNAWYEQKEEELLESLISTVERETREEYRTKDLKYLKRYQ